MAKRIITNPKFIVERDGDNWVLKFKDGNIYKPIEFNNAQLSGRRNRVITQPNFSIEFNDGVPSLLVNIDGVNVNVSNYVAPTPPVPPVPTDRILYKAGHEIEVTGWTAQYYSESYYDENTQEGYLKFASEDINVLEGWGDKSWDYNFYGGRENWDPSITEIIVPSNITIIQKYAFLSARLDYLRIPNTITSITNRAFRFAIIVDFYCEATNPPEISLNGFEGFSGETLHVPANSVSLYQDDPDWSTLFEEIVAI